MKRTTLMIIAAILLPILAVAQEWTAHAIDGNFDGAQSVYATDVDGDGDTDILGAAYYGDDITWWENVNGDGLTWIEHMVDGSFSGAACVFAMDVDGDGDTDVLGAARDDNNITWWENINGDGLDWAEHTIDWDFDGAYSVHATDMDGDGDTDVLGAGFDAGDITWWENIDGGGLTWVIHTVDGNFDGAISVIASDVDGDGDADVLGAAWSLDDISWWENADGGGLTWVEHTVSGDFIGAFCVFATDMDGDGDTDILGAAREGNDIYWWENVDGGGLSLAEHIVDEAFETVKGLYAADVDGDGDTDILGAAYDANEITWWENLDGVGYNWTEHTLNGDFVGAWGVYATDVDSDGDTDILGTAWRLDDISWWEQVGTPYDELQLAIPNGGEAWRIDTPHDIEWISSSEEDVVIELLEGAEIERVISDATANDGIYEWAIPADIIPGDDYRIRLALVTGEEADTSDAPFAITSLPTVSIYPHESPVVIPHYGGGFWYWFEIANPAPFPGIGQYWTEVILPNGSTFGPLSLLPRTLEAWEIFAPGEPTPQWVPAYAPPGTYEYVMNVGVHPDLIVATDSFEFEKLAGAGVATLPESMWSVDDWHNEAWELASAPSADAESAPLPTDYIVSLAHPNPFNASTTIIVSLPDAVELTVAIYNLTGQQVAELAGGNFNAGTHQLTFDASNIASGLYFVRAMVPGRLDQVQKVMLVR